MINLLSLEQRQSFIINICAFFTAVLLLALIGLVGYMLVRGSGFIWPDPIYSLQYSDGNQQDSEAYAQFQSAFARDNSAWLGVSTSDAPFQTQLILSESQIKSLQPASGVAQIDLNDGRIILGKPLTISTPSSEKFAQAVFERHMQSVSVIDEQLNQLSENRLAPLHENIARYNRLGVASDAPARLKIEQEYFVLQEEVIQLEQIRQQYTLAISIFGGKHHVIALSDISRISFPTDMTFAQKLNDSLLAFWQFLTQSPKQANTSGGVFPALFGTIVMVFLMTIIVAPFGVLAAVYLHEYAPKNGLTATIRICVSNMAAVPSIVYGVFGLGFLVYTLGGNLDAMFFEDTLPNPTMGSPGLFWAAVTMALLTLPVVIVATEEGLSRVPQSLRRGSYALGATKFETIWHTVLPIASPSLMTGLILAIARAAGEVAPLMLVGAVRFAPNLPIDGNFPYLHLDRQFMHLGVLIYDGAFHSQTSAKGASMMFAACSLLLLVVLMLNIVAVVLRTRLRERYQ